MGHAEKQQDGIVYELDQYRQQNFNLLVPDIAISGLSIFHKPIIDKITLSPEPKDGDVYFDNNAKGLVISGRGLSKLGTTAGIIWDFDRCRRIDDREDPKYCAYRAVGGLRKPDGAIVWADASYDMDFDALYHQLIESYTEKAKKDNKDQSWIDYCVKRDYQQKYTHKTKLCETGAKNRVIRKLLGIKGTYNQAQLSRPFVMPRIVIQPDYDDPVVKEKMLDAAIQSITGLYGPSSPSAPQEHARFDSNPPDEPSETLTQELDPDAPIGESEIAEEASRRQDFLDAGRDDQIKVLKELATRKGYDLSTLKRPFADWEDKYLIEFYDKLMAMANPQTTRPF